MTRIALRLAIAVAPIAATVLFGFATMEGWLNLGAGEKDIFLAAPLLLWSLIFAVGSLVMGWRGRTVGRSAAVAAAFATALIVVAFAALFVVESLRYR